VQFDWLTVAAQIVNFLVLVWLLQRFLYRPITDAMRRREKRIEERLAEARATRQAAEDEAQCLRERQQELEAEKDAILDAARKDADRLRGKLEQDLRAEIEEKRAAWAKHLDAERDEFLRAFQLQAGRQLVEITGRVLKDYAGSDVADRAIDQFVSRLEDLDEDRRGRLAEAARHSDARAIVQTCSSIDSAARGRMTRAIHELLSTGINVEYGEDEDLVLGVRLIIGDQRLEWSAAHHLGNIKAELNEILEAKTRASDERSPDERGAA
jgi:F-type H+-transporting ATPase subunit b